MGPIGANRGQTGLDSAKWCQTESNGAKPGQTGQNKAKKGLMGLNMAKRTKRAKRGQMGQMGLIFCMHAYFHEIEKSCLATQALRLKLAEL